MNSEGEDDMSETRTVSKYFAQTHPRHAAMAKRKIANDMTVVPKNSRQATCNVEGDDQSVLSADTSDIDDDDWYHSDDGSVSKVYWDFVAKHGTCMMKNYFPDNEKCDRCFWFG